ncbi:hypothetical protein SAMN05216251_102550 [Actinacidiphila alni]|uniref:Uncharacterized protein n=1 Tax=Actinacidiphila alni TaxID=380248 RepID=A0A1I1ZUJ8_9ACTN|nr:hypothetical protein SAMN05216251_102550 [Actinacidiphila alni]
MDVLVSEGLSFEGDAADVAARMTAEELAQPLNG